jgi:hypothetical protein
LRGPGLYLFEQVEPGPVREVDVEQHGVRGLGFERGQSVRNRAGLHGKVVPSLERLAERPSDELFVVDDEYL